MATILRSDLVISDTYKLTDNLQIAPGFKVTVLPGATLDLGHFKLLNFGTLSLEGSTSAFAVMKNGTYNTDSASGALNSTYGNIMGLSVDSFFTEGTLRLVNTLVQNSSIEALSNNDITSSIFINSPLLLKTKSATIDMVTFFDSPVSLLAWVGLPANNVKISNANFVGSGTVFNLDPFFSGTHSVSITRSYLRIPEGSNFEAMVYDATDDLHVSKDLLGSDFLTSPVTNSANGFTVGTYSLSTSALLSGVVSNNTLTGTAANDVMLPIVGNERIDGGDGIDTATYRDSAAHYRLSLRPNAIELSDTVGAGGVDMFVNVEKLQFADKTINIASKAHGSYADLPDTLYQFFVVGFGAAAGVTYMDQMAEAYRYWLPDYGDATVKRIVEVFTTKSQFTGVYSEALYREDAGHYYRYEHDTSQAGSPLVKVEQVSKVVFDEQMANLAQKLIDTIVMDSATVQAKSEAVRDIQGALNLGGDWTIGKVVYTLFGNLANKPLNDQTWGGTAHQFANQVAVSKYYTDTLSQSTDDLQTLRDVMRAVSHISDVSTDENIAQLIGVALIEG